MATQEKTIQVEITSTWKRATFQSHMIMIRTLAEGSDREEGEYLYRNLMQTCAYLERKHGFKK